MNTQSFDVKKIFGERLRTIRKLRGLSQEALALLAGLDRTYISGCERGKRNISLENIWRISKALDINPKIIFMESQEFDFTSLLDPSFFGLFR